MFVLCVIVAIDIGCVFCGVCLLRLFVLFVCVAIAVGCVVVVAVVCVWCR